MPSKLPSGLRQAIERGASNEEIQRLTQDLRQAMDRLMRRTDRTGAAQPAGQSQPAAGAARSQPAQRSPVGPARHAQPHRESVPAMGARDQAQRLMQELQQMLQGLQAGRQQQQQEMGESGEQGENPLDQLSDMIRRQQQLRDQTFRRNQEQRRAQRGQQGQRPGQQGQQRTRPARSAGAAGRTGTAALARAANRARANRIIRSSVRANALCVSCWTNCASNWGSKVRAAIPKAAGRPSKASAMPVGPCARPRRRWVVVMVRARRKLRVVPCAACSRVRRVLPSSSRKAKASNRARVRVSSQGSRGATDRPATRITIRWVVRRGVASRTRTPMSVFPMRARARLSGRSACWKSSGGVCRILIGRRWKPTISSGCCAACRSSSGGDRDPAVRSGFAGAECPGSRPGESRGTGPGIWTSRPRPQPAPDAAPRSPHRSVAPCPSDGQAPAWRRSPIMTCTASSGFMCCSGHEPARLIGANRQDCQPKAAELGLGPRGSGGPGRSRYRRYGRCARRAPR